MFVNQSIYYVIFNRLTFPLARNIDARVNKKRIYCTKTDGNIQKVGLGIFTRIQRQLLPWSYPLIGITPPDYLQWNIYNIWCQYTIVIACFTLIIIDTILYSYVSDNYNCPTISNIKQCSRSRSISGITYKLLSTPNICDICRHSLQV